MQPEHQQRDGDDESVDQAVGGRAVGLFGIGYEIAGASATTYNTAQQIIYQYLMSLNEKQKVVLR